MHKNKRHLYHMVDISPWPLLVSIGALLLTSGLVCYMHRVNYGFFLFFLGLIILISSMIFWWIDIINESTYQGNHTIIVQQGLKIGFILFIFSEIVFFGGFFWAFFHSSLSPAIILGAVWPPVNINGLNPWSVPLLNTWILILSGFSITWTHYSIIEGDFEFAKQGFFVTLFLAFFFTIFQLREYILAPFNISDSIYGSVFYSLTGLHGLHVIIGSIFIAVCTYRFLNNQFTTKHHLGFEFAIWYWHFVDVVRLFLFIFVYIWGNY